MSNPSDTIIVVGVDASSSRFDALQELVSNLPPKSQMSYIVAHHHSQIRKSKMVELLSKVSPIEVIEATDGQKIESGKIFVVSLQEDSADTLSFLSHFKSRDSNEETVMLRLELSRTKQRLETAIYKLDNSNAKLQSLNEEMQSTNEELVTTNEELEATNEELEATNEELQIAYNELKDAKDAREETLKSMETLGEALKARQQLLYSLLVAAMYFRVVQSEQNIAALVCELATRPCEKIVKMLVEEMVGKKIDELFPVELYGSFIELCNSVSTEKHSGELEMEIDYFGETLNFKVVVTACKDGIIVSFDDISGIKTVISQLEQSKENANNERLFRDELLEAANAFISILDESGTIVSFNKQLQEVTGYSKQEVIGLDWFSTFVSPWRTKELRTRFNDMVYAQGSAIWKDEYSIRLKNGSEKPISWQSSTHIDKDGNVNILTFGLDITLRSLLEQQVKLQDDYIHAVTDIQNTITVITDGKHIVDVNRSFFAFFDEFDTIESFKKEHDCVSDYFEKIDGPNFVYDGKDGKNWLEIVAEPGIHQALIKKGDKECYFTLHLLEFNTALSNRKIVSMTNVTELEKHRVRLENKIAEESNLIKMQEALIIQQGKMAALGEMLAAIAHQWRQPLNALSIMTQDVKMAYEAEQLDDAYIDEFDKDSMRIIQHMSSTINEFRDFFKPTTNNEEFLARDALSQSLGIFAPQLAYSNIVIETTLPEGKCDKLFCNKNQLMQVLMSVISNAKDASQEAKDCGGISDILIRAEISCQKSSVRIKIYNSGASIPEEVRARVFEPYYTTKTEGKGTGIGLYICKVIVEQHLKGKISIDNRDGGVEVTIELPMVRG